MYYNKMTFLTFYAPIKQSFYSGVYIQLKRKVDRSLPILLPIPHFGNIKILLTYQSHKLLLKDISDDFMTIN